MLHSKIGRLLLAFALASLTPLAEGTPRNGKARNGASSEGNGSGSKISTASDGSAILDKTVQINGLSIRYRVSAPNDPFTQASGVQGGLAPPNSNGTMGVNVLLHGDGGQSFFDFPNQGVNANLMGVAVLSPDKNRKWGGSSRNGQQRPDGVAHSQAVVDLITNELPAMVAFDQSQVFFTGVSGGSLTLSGFLMPAHMGLFPNSGVLLNCGALQPQIEMAPDAATALANTRIHFQSTTQELESLQQDIPEAIKAYEQVALAAGLSRQQINSLQTADNTPNGGHCAFDEKDFVSGVQLMADNFANVVQAGGNGLVPGIGNVAQGVVGTQLRFSQGRN